MNVAQTKLVIGWRLGEVMEEPDPAALRVFTSLFGGSTASKLFVNVREKLSLCYFASALFDLHKGVLIAYAGTENERCGEARDKPQKKRETKEKPFYVMRHGYYLLNLLTARDFRPF